MVLEKSIGYFIFFLLCTMSVFFYSESMTDSFIVPKWCFSLAISFLLLIFLSVKNFHVTCCDINLLSIGRIIALICFFQALYGWAQWFEWISSNNIYKVVGSFDNPAGFASSLTAGLPFVLLCFKASSSKVEKWFICLSALIITGAVILSESRSGIVSIAVFFGLYFYKRISFNQYLKAFSLICIILLLMCGAYFLKKDSADGRLLIWHCSWELVKEKPLFGHGLDSFRAHYMDYQARFMELYPNNEYVMLADNVISPFSEYLNVLLNFGFVGGLTLVVVFILILYCYYKNPILEKRVAATSILVIAVFSIFSYPFTYPFVWIVLGVNFYILVKGAFAFKVSIIYRRLICVFVASFSLIALNQLYYRVVSEYEWGKIVYCVNEKDLTKFQKLLPAMRNNPYFLYNYSVVLFDTNHLNESLEIALKCREFWADYDLELLLGDICKQKRAFVEAEKYYRKASLMCPCRFIPLHKLFKLYHEIGDRENCHTVAKIINKKEVKIQSAIVRKIKDDVKKYISKK